MIPKEQIETIIGEYPGGDDFFLVDIVIRKGNIIRVYVDRDGGISISECAGISRFIQKSLDRDKEDFELTVSSPGLDRPLQVWKQYRKNKGRKLKIILKDGREVKGVLKDLDINQIILEKQIKKKKKGNRQDKQEPGTTTILFEQIDKANVIISF